LTWEKRKLPKLSKDLRQRGAAIIRVSFLDEKVGWAFGGGKVFYATRDGGLTWAPVKESEDIGLKSENTIWMWMTWVSGLAGMLVGHSAAPPRDASRLPDWMVPERAVRRRLTPSTTVVAETRDGGKTWKTSVASTFGRVMRMRSVGPRAMTLFHYGDGLDFPSEVYELNIQTGRSNPLFRRRGIFVHDAVPLGATGALIAAVEPAGQLRSSPIPSKVRVFVTDDSVRWSEMKVDYRAVGRSVVLSRFDDDRIWLATDEGHILRMV
jgi:hypothetical protein